MSALAEYDRGQYARWGVNGYLRLLPAGLREEEHYMLIHDLL